MKPTFATVLALCALAPALQAADQESTHLAGRESKADAFLG